MIASLALLLPSLALTFASPIVEVRTVAALNQAAFAEAQQRDDTATRAFSSVEITTSTGQCLFVDELSGDFRANLNPIQVGACDGSTGQLWDIITSGKHDNQAGTMLVVNTLTQACMNFDPRRAAGNTVIMFSCGGRADGSGAVTNSQQFNFTQVTAGPLTLEPLNAVGTCLTVTSGNVLDQAPCAAGNDAQVFSFGGNSTAAVTPAVGQITSSSVDTSVSFSAASAVAQAVATSACGGVVFVTVTRGASSSPIQAASSSLSSPSAASSSSSAAAVVSAVALPDSIPNPTTPVPVSRAGGVLQPSAAAEANTRDDTATRAFSSVSLQSSNGQCLFIDPTAGDFREELIPVSVQACTGSPNEKFDLITKGVHNDATNSTLVVSSLMQGCLNFDPRRAVGDTVIIFSCGGRADGISGTTNSQLFAYSSGNSILLAPENGNGEVCLVPNAATGKLDQASCTGGADQLFNIVS